MPHKFGKQVSAGPGYRKHWKGVNGGVSFLYKFFEVERMNFYAYQSNLFAYSKQKNQNTNKQVYAIIKTQKSGIGLGNEINLFNHFYLNFMATVVYATNNYKIYFGDQDAYFQNDSKFELLVENALYYKF